MVFPTSDTLKVQEATRLAGKQVCSVVVVLYQVGLVDTMIVWSHVLLHTLLAKAGPFTKGLHSVYGFCFPRVRRGRGAHLHSADGKYDGSFLLIAGRTMWLGGMVGRS